MNLQAQAVLRRADLAASNVGRQEPVAMAA